MLFRERTRTAGNVYMFLLLTTANDVILMQGKKLHFFTPNNLRKEKPPCSLNF